MDVAAPAAIFIHKGYRTGGTALLDALAQIPHLLVFMDPFHANLLLGRDALTKNTAETWASHHSGDIHYWDSYLRLPDLDAVLELLDADFMQTFQPDTARDSTRSVEYLTALMRHAWETGRVPVFGFERSQGRAGWLEEHFPFALQFGLQRECSSQFSSWLQQVAYGNYHFFAVAIQDMAQSPRIFQAFESPRDSDLAEWSVDELEKVFEAYQGGIDALLQGAGIPSTSILDILQKTVSPELLQLLEAYSIRDHEWNGIRDWLGTHTGRPSDDTRLRLTVSNTSSTLVLRRTAYNTLQNDYDTLRTQYNTLQNDYDTLRTQYNTLQNDYDTLRTQYNTLQNDYDTLRTQYNTLQNDYDTLRTQYNTLESSRIWRSTSWYRKLRSRTS